MHTDTTMLICVWQSAVPSTSATTFEHVAATYRRLTNCDRPTRMLYRKYCTLANMHSVIADHNAGVSDNSARCRGPCPWFKLSIVGDRTSLHARTRSR